MFVSEHRQVWSQSHLPMLAIPLVFIFYYFIVIFLYTVFLVNFGRVCVGTPRQVSCHLTRSVNILRIVHCNNIIKFSRGCAPYVADFICPPMLAKPIFFIIYYLIVIFLYTVFFSELRQGVLMHTSLGELPSHAQREHTQNSSL